MYTTEELSYKPKSEINKIAKELGIDNYTKLEREELITQIAAASAKTPPVTYKPAPRPVASSSSETFEQIRIDRKNKARSRTFIEEANKAVAKLSAHHEDDFSLLDEDTKNLDIQTSFEPEIPEIEPVLEDEIKIDIIPDVPAEIPIAPSQQ